MNHPLEISPTKVRPSKVDDQVHPPILEYLEGERFDLSPEDEVWSGRGIIAAPGLTPDSYLCWPTRADAQAAGETGVRHLLLKTLFRYARNDGSPSVILVDANLNVLKEWPVSQGGVA